MTDLRLSFHSSTQNPGQSLSWNTNYFIQEAHLIQRAHCCLFAGITSTRRERTNRQFLLLPTKSYCTEQQLHKETHRNTPMHALQLSNTHSLCDPEAVSVMWLWECRWDLCFSDCNNRDQMGTCGQNSKPGAEHSGACLSPFWCRCFSWELVLWRFCLSLERTQQRQRRPKTYDKACVRKIWGPNMPRPPKISIKVQNWLQ